MDLDLIFKIVFTSFAVIAFLLWIFCAGAAIWIIASVLREMTKPWLKEKLNKARKRE